MQEYESEAFKRDIALARDERLMPAPSCIKCTHFKMCKIAGNMFPMMESMFGMLLERDRPFKAEDVAKLCQWYDLKEEEENGGN